MAITSGYATLAEYKLFQNIASTDTDDDKVIEDLIEGSSRLIDRETGRTFYARTETRYYDVPEERLLRMDDDLLTITTLTNGDAATIASTEYNTVPKNTTPYYGIRLKEASSYYWAYDSDGNTEDVISIAGTWGWAATRPDDINIACLMIAASAYKRRLGESLTSTSTITAAGIVVTPQDIPSGAWRTMNAYRKRF